MIIHIITILNNSVSENTKKSKQICDQIYNQSLYNDGLIFDLLITTADFELKIKDTFKSVSFNIEIKCVFNNLYKSNFIYSGFGIQIIKVVKHYFNKHSKLFHKIYHRCFLSLNKSYSSCYVVQLDSFVSF